MNRLSHFVATRPRYEVSQAQSLAWLTQTHTDAQTTLEHLGPAARDRFETRLEHVTDHVACSPEQIGNRGCSVAGIGAGAGSPDRDGDELYDVHDNPHGQGTAERTNRFAALVDAYFERTYAGEPTPPDDLIHVTCTGYVSPNGAQKLVAQRGWGASTRVTTAYHMGCYAALSALRIANGLVAAGSRRVDLAHTELCSLHLDPANHSLEQLVVQSLFADGLIRYSMSPEHPGCVEPPGLRVLALHEQVLPDSSDAMTWRVSDTGMQMTLARDVPERIAGALRGFVVELFARAKLGIEQAKHAVFAVHPGGPRIIDCARNVLELDESQVAVSRGVLHDYGNMSSATLPHIWMRMIDDPRIPAGTLIPSLAFGPGLTVCGGLLQKQ